MNERYELNSNELFIKFVLFQNLNNCMNPAEQLI